MKVLVAPDALKGCLSAPDVAAAIAAGLRAEWPTVDVCERPLSDGGEGLLGVLDGVPVVAECSGPHGERVAGRWVRDGDRAWIEMAVASGLSVTGRRDPRTASTRGTGELVAAAREAGSRSVWVGAGGSATVDGGLGALAALGYTFRDAAGRATRDLGAVQSVVPGLPLDDVTVLCDVDNPLVGPEGAAAVYGPQKGASPDDVAWLDGALRRFAEALRAATGRDARSVAGAGAGGGLAGGLWAAGATLRPGLETVAEQVGLPTAMEEAELVITAEGRVDGQTGRGKTVAGVVRRAAPRPVWVVAGEVTPEAEAWAPDHVALVPIADGPRSLEASRADAVALLRRATRRTARLWALAAGLVVAGCGGGGAPTPAGPPPGVHIAVEHQAGSGYRSGCLGEAGVYALRAYTLERWDLPAGAPPALRARIPVGALGETPPATSVGCDATRALVVLGDSAVGVEGDAVTWRGRRDEADGWPAPTTGRTPPPGARWAARLSDGRETLVGEWGRGTRRSDTYEEWRPVAGGMRAAVWDGARVWAVGPSGLWRWRPGPGEPTPVPLPAGLAGRPLVGLFREANGLWVRDAEQVGYPLDTAGPVARLVGNPGPLPPDHDELMFPVSGGRVAARIGQPGLVMVDAEGGRHPVDTGRIDALVPLPGDRAAAALGDTVVVWWIDERLAPRELGRIDLGAPSVALFEAGDRLLAVGPDYGFASLRLSAASP